jgi:hypothetical protein
MADPSPPALVPSTTQAAATSPAVATPRRDPIAVLRRIPPSVTALALTALALALMSWPVSSLHPGAGVDPSWASGLHMALAQGLDAGTDVVFSYGPLGFLHVPIYAFPWTTRISFAYVFAQQFLLCVLLLWVLRRNFGTLLIAAPIALVIATLCYQEPGPVIVFAVAVCVLRGEFAPRAVPWILAGTGALVAVQLLTKLNVGTTLLALCVIALLGLSDRQRRVAIAWFTGGLAVTLIGCWVLTGQSLAGIPEYVSGSLQVISGYSEAMGYEDPGRAWELWAALALTVVGLAIVMPSETRGSPRTKRALVVAWLVLAFTAFKTGFVRHDDGHGNIYFATMLGGLAALPLTRLSRSGGAFVLLFATMLLLASSRADPARLISPIDRTQAFFDQAGTLADGSKLNAEIVNARGRLQRAYALDPRIYAALRGHPAHVEPNEMNVLWAYQLPWKPIPVFQSYTAFTADLDARNARAYDSAAGPERVLRHATPAIDGRDPAWESPAAIRAMLCNFREVVTVAPWQVLERVPNRCGPPRLLRETAGRIGAPVPLPPWLGPRTMVYMELDGVAVSGIERISTFAYRARDRTLTFAGSGPYRLVPGTAEDGLLVHVPPAIDFRAPFSLEQPDRPFVVGRGADSIGDPIRVRFYAVDVR